MKISEKLKYKARRYIYQIEQEAYINKSKVIKEEQKAQKIYNQKNYNENEKNYNGKKYIMSQSQQENKKQENTKQDYTQENYNKEKQYGNQPAQKHYKDFISSEYQYTDEEYKKNQIDYYDVYPDEYMKKNTDYSYSEKDYWLDKENTDSKKRKKGKKIIAKLDEIEDYLEETLSGIKRK